MSNLNVERVEASTTVKIATERVRNLEVGCKGKVECVGLENARLEVHNARERLNNVLRSIAMASDEDGTKKRENEMKKVDAELTMLAQVSRMKPSMQPRIV